MNTAISVLLTNAKANLKVQDANYVSKAKLHEALDALQVKASKRLGRDELIALLEANMPVAEEKVSEPTPVVPQESTVDSSEPVPVFDRALVTLILKGGNNKRGLVSWARQNYLKDYVSRHVLESTVADVLYGISYNDKKRVETGDGHTFTVDGKTYLETSCPNKMAIIKDISDKFADKCLFVYGDSGYRIQAKYYCWYFSLAQATVDSVFYQDLVYRFIAESGKYTDYLVSFRSKTITNRATNVVTNIPDGDDSVWEKLQSTCRPAYDSKGLIAVNHVINTAENKQ